MASTYSEREVKKMIDIYTDNPCLEVVDKISVMFNKPRKSVISKLVKEGVYIKRGYLSKTGEAPITKLELVRGIEDSLDLKLPGLDKAPKGTLKMLHQTITEVADILEETVEELRDKTEIIEAQVKMLESIKAEGRSVK